MIVTCRVKFRAGNQNSRVLIKNVIIKIMTMDIIFQGEDIKREFSNFTAQNNYLEI